MKKVLLILFLFFNFLVTKSQCINITSASFSNPSGDNITWRLSVSWTAYGQKHFTAIVRNGVDTIMNICSEINRTGISSGIFIYDSIITNGGLTQLVATFKRYDGLCGSGLSCGTDTTIFYSAPLSIKFNSISAKNIGNTTRVIFNVGEVDNVDYVNFNFTLPNKTIKTHKIQFQSKLRPNETWQVEIDNVTGIYTTKKLP